MPRSFCRAAAVTLGLLIFVAAAPTNAEELIGTWLTQQADAHIRVAKCGKAMCGTVVWLKDAIDPKTGQPQADDKNPNPSLRSRKVFGIRIFAMEQDASGSWTGGWKAWPTSRGRGRQGRSPMSRSRT